VRPFLPAGFLVLLLPTLAYSATLTVDVRNVRAQAVRDAVVYAVPEGKTFPLAKKTATMDQKNRMFVPHVLPVQTGTSVKFPNSDDIRHQVYSFSTAKTFQLPLYAGTPSTPIVFDKAGVATLGCNIHDRMSAYIVVVDTPYFAATGAKGRVTLSDLSAGKYNVYVWHSDLKTEPLAVTLAANDQRPITFTLR
jgi:plastocyanin